MKQVWVKPSAVVLLICAWCFAAYGGAYSYMFLQDVTLPAYPQRINFSKDGTCLNTENSSADKSAVVFLDESTGKSHTKVVPGGSTGWGPNNELYINSLGLQDVVLPSYKEVVKYEQRVLSDPTAASSLERLAVAAWMYCDNASFRVMQCSGKPVFNTVKELAALTTEAFASQKQPSVVEIAAATVSKAAEIYLADSRGRLFSAYPPKAQVFWADGRNMTEITGADVSGAISSCDFDPTSTRVLLQIKPGLLVCDYTTGERHIIPTMTFGADRTTRKYFLVPGADVLVVRGTEEDERGNVVIDYWLELADLDGRVTQEIPTDLEGVVNTNEVGVPAISRHLLAVPLRRDDEQVWSLRVFRGNSS